MQNQPWSLSGRHFSSAGEQPQATWPERDGFESVSSSLSLPSVLSIFSAVLSYEGKNAKQIIFKKSCVDALIYCCGHTEICIHSPSSRLHLWHYYWTGCFNHSDGKSGFQNICVDTFPACCRARSVVRMDTAMEHHATRLVKFIFYIQFMFSACFIC